MPSIDELLNAQRSAGTVESTGHFQIDVKKALEKLGKALLPDAERAILKMVQFGVAQKAMAVTIETTTHGHCVHFLGLHEEHPASQMLAAMVDVLAGSVADRRLDVMMGLNYFLAQGADVLVARWQSGLLLDAASTVRGGASCMEGHPDLRFPDSLSIELRFPAKPRANLNHAKLRQELAFCPTLVSLDKHKLNDDHQYSGGDGYKHHADLRCVAGGQTVSFGVTTLVRDLTELEGQSFQAEVIPVKHGVALESVRMTAGAPGIRLVMNADDLDTSLGGLDLQRNAEWEARRPVLEKLLESVSDQVHAKARQNSPSSLIARLPSPGRPLASLLKMVFVSCLFLAIFYATDFGPDHDRHGHPVYHSIENRALLAAFLALSAAVKVFN